MEYHELAICEDGGVSTGSSTAVEDAHLETISLLAEHLAGRNDDVLKVDQSGVGASLSHH